MTEIRHSKSGRVLMTVEADTLERANLSGAYLIHAELSGMNLAGAMLPYANLSGARLSCANLAGADLRGANLTEVDLSGADLSGANLAGATLSATDLRDCPTLQAALGLAEALHLTPSTLGEATLRATIASLPDAFLRGTGYTASEIRQYRIIYRSGG